LGGIARWVREVGRWSSGWLKDEGSRKSMESREGGRLSRGQLKQQESVR
jgi:hypothetical protein